MITLKLNSILTKKWNINIPLSIIEPYIVAFCLFLLIPPYFTWHVGFRSILIFACFIVLLRHVEFKDYSYLILFLLVVVMYLYISFRMSANPIQFFAYTSIVVLFFVSNDFMLKTYNAFVKIFAITIIPSILFFILIFYLKVDLSYSIIPPYNELKSYDYRVYPFLVHANTVGSVLFPRFFSYYDEPGVVGTIAAIILLSSRFNLKKKTNIPVFIAGIISFSLAFWFTFLTYILVFSKLKTKIIILVIAITSVGFLSQSELFNRYVLERLRVEDGTLAGDTRATRTNPFYKEFIQTSDVYFGIGYDKSIDITAGDSSYKVTIIRYGVIPFFIFLFIVSFFAFLKLGFSTEFFVYLFLLFLIMYQRPYITVFFYMFLMLAPIISLNVYKVMRLNKKLSTNTN